MWKFDITFKNLILKNPEFISFLLPDVKVKKVEPLATELHMRMKMPDLVFRIHTKDGRRFILHIEIVAENDPELPIRMLKYYVLLLDRYGEEVEQVVIYVGRRRPKIPRFFRGGVFQRWTFTFRFVDITSIRPEDFLSRKEPFMWVLGVVSRYADEGVLGEVVGRLRGL